MTLPADTVAALAAELDQAERSRTQIPLISRRFPAANLADAYAVQDAWVRLKLAAGRRRIAGATASRTRRPRRSSPRSPGRGLACRLGR